MSTKDTFYAALSLTKDEAVYLTDLWKLFLISYAYNFDKSDDIVKQLH